MKSWNGNNQTRSAITLTIVEIIALMRRLQGKGLLIIDESRYRSSFLGLRSEIENAQVCLKPDDPYLALLLKQLPDVQKQYHQSQVELQEFTREERQNEADLVSLYDILVGLINKGFSRSVC